jgi:hypothetical protein
MPITLYLKGGSFDPETIEVMGTALVEALSKLGLNDRRDPMTELVAAKIIELASQGERNPARLASGALQSLKT